MGQLLALAGVAALDRLDHAGDALEVEDGILQLGVQHVAVAHDQHAGEHLVVLGVVQVREEVRRPGNRIGLARAGRVLDQVLAARPLGQRRLHQPAGGVELVIAREDDGLDLLLVVAHGDQVALDDFEPRVALPDLLPQVVSAVAGCIRRVAGAAGIAQVEGQELGGRAKQARGHVHVAVADGKVHQRAAWEVEQGFGGGFALGLGNPVEAVLVDGLVDVLREVGLDLGSGHRDAVQEQHQIDDVVVVGANLAQHAQAVGGVPGLQLGVHAQSGPELGHAQRGFQTQHVEAVAQHFKGSSVIQGFAQAVEKDGFGGAGVVLGDGFPGLGLGGLQPGDQVCGVEGARGVVAAGIAFRARCRIEPAMGTEVVADVAL